MFGLSDDLQNKIDALSEVGDAMAIEINLLIASTPKTVAPFVTIEHLENLLKRWTDARDINPWE